MKFMSLLTTLLSLLGCSGRGVANQAVAEFEAAAAKPEVAVIDVRTPEEYARGIFTYEDQSFDKFLEIKEGEIYRISVTEVDVWVSDWASLQAAIKNENNKDKVIGLSNDITAASGRGRLPQAGAPCRLLPERTPQR